MWLNARELLGQTLEGAVEGHLGRTWRHGRGASIAVDGLDETDPATAETLLEDARALTRTYANVRVLLTARPGILTPTTLEEVAAPLLDEDKALELVELAAGSSHVTWRWTADLRATATRPFFALAAGVILRRGGAPSGIAGLVRGLVEDALAKGTERWAVTASETRSVLEKLAVALTKTGKDGLSFSDRQIARSSRLVADNAGGSVVFSLPIFQHWFAAQAILAGDVPAAEVVANARNFNRWRWAAAVAALSAPDAQATDSLLETWVAGNPGAAAWIINEAFSGRRDSYTEDSEDLDSHTSGLRFLQALRTWTDSLGPLADGVLPSPVVQGPVGLGVTLVNRRIDVAFSTSRPTADYVTEVPPGVHPLLPDATPHWWPWTSRQVPDGNAWPWIMVLNVIANATLQRLSNDPFLGSPDGIWVQERRFDCARRLLDRGSLFDDDLPADEVRKRAVETFDAVGRDRDALVSFRGSSVYSGAELEDLVSWIDATAPTHVTSGLPQADIRRPASGWVWDRYSPERLMKFEAEVYGRACEAYDEALAHTFTRTGWSMPNSALAPFGVVLELSYDHDSQLSAEPHLTTMKVPTALMTEIASSSRGATWSASGRAVITQISFEQAADRELHSARLRRISSWLAQQSREPTGSVAWAISGPGGMSSVRPASGLAASWLANDLQDLGLASGTFSQLR